MCTDNSCNVVLSNCEEFLTQEDVVKAKNRDTSETVNIRTLGLAIVPGDQILTISVQDTLLSNELLEHINSSNNTTASSSETSISS
ncbi:PREDICTED: N-alpha-acetyltransferase 38, NatC auxiliary subunit-like [Amphimedon queenslandica]|uniref:Sm domain-containing protein n=1 Tax=Amphimedon queenslandica TaxID=400682 RepID=A0A1X7SGT9_AMPQE|nr:PREDICTED: N-alpha-acetyltransferase 38, NatC auxiliary subunit-like [Amphimedon queenslandica]|eukprot:XP_011409407.1 PREDICTED: N-alpha-acetyltransferase 38, NatC auxiliary subunit-like [Amphimedon queenslandica]